MPTDLQRIELAFPAEVMLHVVDHGADPKDPAVQRVRRLLIGTVDEAFAGALAAGATALKRPETAFWGGYSGYLADPDGHIWELAHNPFFPLDADGNLVLPA